MVVVGGWCHDVYCTVGMRDGLMLIFKPDFWEENTCIWEVRFGTGGMEGRWKMGI